MTEWNKPQSPPNWLVIEAFKRGDIPALNAAIDAAIYKETK